MHALKITLMLCSSLLHELNMYVNYRVCVLISCMAIDSIDVASICALYPMNQQQQSPRLSKVKMIPESKVEVSLSITLAKGCRFT